MNRVSVKLKREWNGNNSGTVLPIMEKPRADVLVKRGFAEYTGGSIKSAEAAAAKHLKKSNKAEPKEKAEAEAEAEPKEKAEAEPKEKAEAVKGKTKK